MNVPGRINSVNKIFCCPSGKGYAAGVLPCRMTYKNSPKYYEGTAQLFKKNSIKFVWHLEIAQTQSPDNFP